MTPYHGDVILSSPSLPVSIAPGSSLTFNIVGCPSDLEAGTLVGSLKISYSGVDSTLDLKVKNNGSSLNLETEGGDFEIMISRTSIGGGVYQGTFSTSSYIDVKEITIDWPS